MPGYINELRDIDDNVVYPMTASGAVLTGINRTLNDDLSNIYTKFDGLEKEIKIWQYKIPQDFTISSTGLWTLSTIYTEQIDKDGLVVTPVPRDSKIIDAKIIRWDGYYSSLTPTLNPNTGLFCLHGLPSNKLKAILGTTTESHYTVMNAIIAVTYIEDE